MTSEIKCKKEKLNNPFLYATLKDLPQVGKVEFYIDGLVDISGLTINQPNILGKKAKVTEFYCPLYNKLYRDNDNKLKQNFINFSATDISKNLLEKITDKTKMENYIKTTYFKEKTLNFSPKQIEQYNKDCIIFPKEEILVNNAIIILRDIIFNNKDAKIFYKTLQDHRLERQERAYYLVNYPNISNSDISRCSLTNTQFVCEIIEEDKDKDSPNAEKILKKLLYINEAKINENYNNKVTQTRNYLFGNSKDKLLDIEENQLTKALLPYKKRSNIEKTINDDAYKLVLYILNHNTIRITRKDQSNLIDFLIKHLKPEKPEKLDKLPSLIEILDNAPTDENIKKYKTSIKKIYITIPKQIEEIDVSSITLSKTIEQIDEELTKKDADKKNLKKEKEELQKEKNKLQEEKNKLHEEKNKLLKDLFEKLLTIQFDNILNNLPSEVRKSWISEGFTKYFLNEVIKYFDYFFEKQNNILNIKKIKTEIKLRFKINENNLKLVEPPSFQEKREEFFLHCKNRSNVHEFRNLTIKEKQIVNNCKLLCGYPNENKVSDCSNNFACNLCKPFVNCSFGTCIENQCPDPSTKKIKSVTNCTKKIKKDNINEEGYDDDNITVNPKTDDNDSKDLTDKYSDFFDNFAKIKRKTLKPQQYPTKIFAMSEPSGQTQVRGGKSKKNRYKLTIKKYRKQNKKTQKRKKIKKKMTRQYIKKKYYSKMSYKKRKTIKR